MNELSSDTNALLPLPYYLSFDGNRPRDAEAVEEGI